MDYGLVALILCAVITLLSLSAIVFLVFFYRTVLGLNAALIGMQLSLGVLESKLQDQSRNIRFLDEYMTDVSARVGGMEKSTHKVEYVPAENMSSILEGAKDVLGLSPEDPRLQEVKDKITSKLESYGNFDDVPL